MSQQAGVEAKTNTKYSTIMKRKIRHVASASAASLRALVSVAFKKNAAQTIPVDFHHERRSVCCIATRRQADQIVSDLKTAQFSEKDISVVSQEQGTTHDFARGKQTKAVEGTVVGAGTGGVVGGAVGWLVGLATLAVLGCDPWIVGLSVGALGSVVLGIAGGRVGRGIPHIRRGDILIAVHARNSGEIARVKGIFTDAKAQDGCQRGETSVGDLPPPVWSRCARRGLAQPVLAEFLLASA